MADKLILGTLTISVIKVFKVPKVNAPYPTKQESLLITNFLKIF